MICPPTRSRRVLTAPKPHCVAGEPQKTFDKFVHAAATWSPLSCGGGLSDMKFLMRSTVRSVGLLSPRSQRAQDAPPTPPALCMTVVG